MPPRRVRPRTIAHRIGYVGAAGFTAALGVAPLAHADPTPAPSESPTSGPSSTPSTGSASTTPAPTPGASSSATPTSSASPSETAGPTPSASVDPTGSPTPAAGPRTAGGSSTPQPRAAVEPVYGLQKYRVGVQIGTGAYVPDGTVTAGSVLTITETGPGNPQVFECTTSDTPPAPGSTLSYCDDPPFYVAAPGDTVTVSQRTAATGLVVATTSAVLPPCVPDGGAPACDDTTDLVLDDYGPPPTAQADTGKVRSTGHVDLAVTRNDDPAGAPITSLAVATAPAHGRVRVIRDGQLRYTPDRDFSGRDTLTYTLTTGNGSATATVTVTVTAPPAAPAEPEPGTPHHGSGSTLAATGASAGLGSTALLGSLLSGAGAALVFLRWRSARRHRG